MSLERYAERDGMARWIRTAQPAADFADRIADTEFVPAAMRGRPAMVAACIMYGDEIGVGPMQALASIHVVDGRPFPSAELLRALILRDGHSFGVVESTGTKCRVVGVRMANGQPTTEPVYVEWTIEMARAAGLAGKGAWRSYPRALLLARASTDLARMVFPDVVKGLGHVPDDGAIASDYNELAEASGLPTDSAPDAPRSIQWKGARRSPDPSPGGGAAVSPETPRDAPLDVPWADDPATPPEAVETPVVAADESERPVSREQVTRIMAAYGDLGYGDDRGTRLALFSALLGFPVASTKELERMAGYRLFGDLTKLRDGSLVAVADGHGTFTIHAGTEPEDEDG